MLEIITFKHYNLTFCSSTGPRIHDIHSLAPNRSTDVLTNVVGASEMYVYNYMIWHLQTAASIFYRVFSQELYACNFLIRYRNVLTFCQIFCVLYNVFGPCAICICVHSQWKTLPKCAEGAAGSNENLENI